MTDEPRCEPPPEWRDRDGRHWVQADAERLHPAKWSTRDEWWDFIHISGSACEIGQLGYRYLAPVTPPATVAALVEALEGLMGVQTFATGWDNGVTDATGTMNEGDHWHGLAMDRATAALRLYRGEAGR